MRQLKLIERPSQNQIYTDTAFENNKELPFHRWVNWIAGFSELFVTEALQRHLPIASSEFVILDPFSGIGTTPITASLQGYSTIGYEINPFPAFVTDVKYRAIHDLIPETLGEAIHDFRAYMSDISGEPTAQPPPGFRSRIPFYSPRVLRKVLHAWDYFNTLQDRPRLFDLFKVAFSAVMVSFSNYSYEPSLGSRPASGKALIEDADVAGVITSKLRDIYEDIAWARTVKKNGGGFRIANHSFFGSTIEPESVDLLITSPPYLNNYHYIRNTRPQLFWLGFAKTSADLEHLETGNYGKYWQTVRENNYSCSLSITSQWLSRLLDRIRSVESDRSVYGGHGWANYACEYFNDTVEFLRIVHDALKPRRNAVIVIGNSVIKGVDVPTDKVFAYVGKELGFRKAEILRVRNTRVGSSIVGTGVRIPGKGALYESVVELKK